MNVPNFFIVGAAKAGTTSLHQYLSAHPEIVMPDHKEPNYFTHEEIEEQGLYYKKENVSSKAAYLSLFSGKGSVKGEASVSYLFYPKTAKKIKAMNPEAKIVIVLRDPTKRAYSHYQMDKRLGYVDECFTVLLQRKAIHPLRHLYYQQFFELGLYYEQVKRYMDTFSPDQLCILLFDDLIEQPEDTVRKIYRFLGVDDTVIIPTIKKHNEHKEPRNKWIKHLYRNPSLRKSLKRITPGFLRKQIERVGFDNTKAEPLSIENRKALREYYKSDVQQLEKLIGRDLSEWYD